MVSVLANTLGGQGCRAGQGSTAANSGQCRARGLRELRGSAAAPNAGCDTLRLSSPFLQHLPKASLGAAALRPPAVPNREHRTGNSDPRVPTRRRARRGPCTCWQTAGLLWSRTSARRWIPSRSAPRGRGPVGQRLGTPGARQGPGRAGGGRAAPCACSAVRHNSGGGSAPGPSRSRLV